MVNYDRTAQVKRRSIMIPLVSIIVPIYNPDEELLASCLDSIMKQTYRNIEIVIVNDGSTNNALQICSEMKKKSSNIIIINQDNQGVSAARNNGTLQASGTYVFYVDGDDVLSPIAIQEGVEYIIKYNADVVIAAIEKIRTYQEFDIKHGCAERYEILTSNQYDKLRRQYIGMRETDYKNINGNGNVDRGPYCRLIRKEIALRCKFPVDISIGEDIIWNMRLLNMCKTVCVVFNNWYGYLIANGSAIRKYYGDRRERAEKYLRLLWEENDEFFERNIGIYGKNAAIEFYCILRYDLMSNQCRLSNKEKNALVRKMIQNWPWSILRKTDVQRILPRKYKYLIALCIWGLWYMSMKLYLRGAQ
jgi:glycosyltransferase involved in cell wall biosynthesis